MTPGVKKQIDGRSWEAYYREYQRELVRRFLMPVLLRWGVELRNARVLEVGSGNGGCGAALHSAGASVTALEIDERLVTVSREFNALDGIDITVYRGDIRDAACPAFADGPFDLVIMRDVIEHIADPRAVLENIGANLCEGAAVFIVFPPYYSPYGAHQQILPAKRFLGLPWNKLPWLQLLPAALFLRMADGDDPQSHEVRRLRGVRLTLRGFETAAGEADFRIHRASWYLSRPSFKLRYGLPVIGASFLGRIPLLRELAVTAAYYLLEKKKTG